MVEEDNGKFRGFACTDFVMKLQFWENMFKKLDLQYIVIGEEICPDTKKLHWQIFFYKKNASTKSAVIKLLKPRHIENIKGTPEQNITYCTKDQKIILERGIPPKKQGERTDLAELAVMIKENKSLLEIFEKQPGNFLRYHKSIERAKQLYKTKRNWEMNVIILWGPPGSGKSRTAYDTHGVDNVYKKMIGKWWDDYNGEEVVLIDDFDPFDMYDITYGFYLQLLDRYPMRVECKGGSYEFCSKTIYITSNHDPNDWFTERSNRDAFFRRVKEIRYIGLKA